MKPGAFSSELPYLISLVCTMVLQSMPMMVSSNTMPICQHNDTINAVSRVHPIPPIPSLSTSISLSSDLLLFSTSLAVPSAPIHPDRCSYFVEALYCQVSAAVVDTVVVGNLGENVDAMAAGFG